MSRDEGTVGKRSLGAEMSGRQLDASNVNLQTESAEVKRTQRGNDVDGGRHQAPAPSRHRLLKRKRFAFYRYIKYLLPVRSDYIRANDPE